MKPDQQRPSSPSSTRVKVLVAKVPPLLVFLAAGYILGFLTASSNQSSPPSSLLPVHLHNITTTTVAHDSLSLSPLAAVKKERTITTTTSTKTSSAAPPPPHDLLRFRNKCSDPVAHQDVLKTVLDKVYEGVSPYQDFPTKETAALLLPPSDRPRGWGSRGTVFADLISSVGPKVIIELGTFLGASALHMASLTRNESTIILCIDDFRGWPGFRQRFKRDVPRATHGDSLLLQQFMAGVVHAGETERVVPLPFSTASALAALCELGIYGDLVEVDAGHDFHSAWIDINMAYAILRPGGVLFGHDYFTKADNMGVRRAVKLFAKVNGIRVTANGQHWVFSPKPSNRNDNILS